MPAGQMLGCQVLVYRFAVPRTSFFTLRFAEPRAYSRGLSGLSVLRFLRTVRLAFLRSSLLSALVFAMSAVNSFGWIIAEPLRRGHRSRPCWRRNALLGATQGLRRGLC